MFQRIGKFWCKTMHKQALWPIHGRYLCTRCLREHKVEWENPSWPAQPASEPARDRRVSIASTLPATR